MQIQPFVLAIFINYLIAFLMEGIDRSSRRYKNDQDIQHDEEEEESHPKHDSFIIDNATTVKGSINDVDHMENESYEYKL